MKPSSSGRSRGYRSMAQHKHAERGITRLERWPLYIGGILTETLYVLGLTGAALLMAVIAMAIWR